MRKNKDLFKKIGDIKGTFLVRMGMIKDRKGKDLTEAEDIKKRWQKYRKTVQQVLVTGITTMVLSLI